MTFKPEYKRLNNSQTGMLAMLIVGKLEDIPENDKPHMIKVIEKRIDVLNLPVKFTPNALYSTMVFCENVGSAIVFLIDALTKFEGEEVTLNMVYTELYPNGFYTRESFEDYIDNYIKPKNVKWSEIY